MKRIIINQIHWKQFQKITRLLATTIVAISSIQQGNTASPAGEAGFTLIAEQSTGSLTDYAVLWGKGWMESTGTDKTDNIILVGRTPINRYRWTTAGFRFVPKGDGWATLRFHHPDNAGQSGTKNSSAIVFDSINAQGTVIINGNLDIYTRDTPEGWNWTNGQGQMTQTTPQPESGSYCATLPTGAGIQQRIHLRADVPVIIRFAARAVPPPAFKEMKRLPNTGTPAHDAIRYFQKGINLGNYLEAPPSKDWGATYSVQDYDAIHAEGFDHVRIPCAWHHYMGPAPEFEISSDFFTRVDTVVTQALARKLAVIINWHHFDDFNTDPEAHLEQLDRGWAQIARNYADMPGRITLELLNEPRKAANTATLNKVYAQLIKTIRAITPDITLLAGPGEWNSAAELGNLRLPADDDNIIVTIHDYNPFLFTHQGAAWTMPLTAVTNIIFPGPPSTPLTPPDDAPAWVKSWFTAFNVLPTEFNPCGMDMHAIGEDLLNARAWSDYYGRPVHVGEWGCINMADPVSRAGYLTAKRRLMNELNLPWTMWDWKAHFNYWDSEQQVPAQGLRQALFP